MSEQLFQSTMFLYSIIFVLGLCVGSFLNVVIYRLPSMLLTQEGQNFNLFFPRSHCPNCKDAIKPWHNIPIFGYIILKGQCRNCHHRISWRYPLIELFTAVLSVYIIYHFGFNSKGLLACLFTWFLTAMIIIDVNEFLLPDLLTLPLLWLGLLANLKALFVPLDQAVIGAVVGYLSLWFIFHVFKLITHKEGMGYGDFKLFAAIGAWLGWPLLLPVILVASCSGAVIGIILLIFTRFERNQPLPFGPFLAIAGWLVFMAREFFWYNFPV